MDHSNDIGERSNGRGRGELAFHVTMRMVGDWTLATEPGSMRAISCMVLERGKARGLLGFRVADTHMHAVVACSRGEAGRFAQVVEGSLRQARLVPAQFEPARIRPVMDQGHLTSSLRYLMRQEQHHGFWHDAAHDGSSLLDTVGLRVVEPGLAERVARFMPRLRAEDCLGLVGWAGLFGAAPAWDELYEAAAAAFGRASLAGRDALTVSARAAAVHLARRAGLRPGRIADSLRMSRRAECYAATAPPPEGTRAVAMQLRLRGLLATHSAECTSDRRILTLPEVIEGAQ